MVIYFNQWVSSISLVLEDIKSTFGDDITIIASSRNKNHVYKNYVDKFIVEDWEEIPDSYTKSMNNYVDFVLQLCKDNNVSIFFVKKHAVEIAEAKDRFERIGVKLIQEVIETVNTIENKSLTYDLIKNNCEEYKWLIPDYINTSNIKDLLGFIDSKSKKGADICIKFNADEGGASFRHIVDKRPTMDSLYKYRVNEITTSEVYELLMKDIHSVEKIIVMDMLDSPEISVDCYNSRNGFVAVCREKVEGRVERIFYNNEIAKICKKIGEQFNLKFIYNVQFRVVKDGDSNTVADLRLLEINARMSGGIYLMIPKKMNMANILLYDVMDKTDKYSVDTFKNFEDFYVTHMEMPVLL